MSGNIWVPAEHWRGEVSDVTYELLALGSEIAGARGVKLEAILIGHNAAGLAGCLGKADRVISIDDPRMAEPSPEIWAEVTAALAMERAPGVILVPLTNISLGAGTLLAARLKSPAINFCKDVRVKDGRLEAACLLYGGKIQVVAAPSGEPAVLAMWPGARPVAAGKPDRTPEFEPAGVTISDVPRPKLRRYIEPEAGDIDITREDVLIGVGRGIESKENLQMAEELARALGGAVCGSRPVIDQGWLPLSRQVGKSGRTIRPKLYIAVGISGAPEHVEGMRDAELIVAVNKDPAAPIFSVAHYGVVGEAMDVLPELAGAIQAARG